MNNLRRADPQKDRSREQTDALQNAVVRHHYKGRLEKFLRDGEKLVQHGVTEGTLGGCRFHYLDSLDDIDMMRTEFDLDFFNPMIQRTKHFYHKNHYSHVRLLSYHKQ